MGGVAGDAANAAVAWRAAQRTRFIRELAAKGTATTTATTNTPRELD